MQTFASLADINYRTENETNDVRYCGACQFSNHTGNVMTCERVDPPRNRVEPRAICDKYRKRRPEGELVDAE